MNTVHVTASKNYEVHIGAGLLKDLGAYVTQVKKVKKVCIVSDTNVQPIYGKIVEKTRAIRL